MNQNLKNVAEGTLPRWKMRVRNKKMKERQRYDFTLEESFPHSPILQKKNNWGLENSYRKLKEWLGNDLQKKYNLNLKIQFERAARESKNNHFMLYSLMKRRITSDKHLFFGKEILMNLMRNIVNSTILKEEEKMKRFELVSGRYIKEGHPKNIEFYQNYFQINQRMFKLLDDAEKALALPGIVESSFIIYIIKGLLMNRNHDCAYEFFFKHHKSCRPEELNQCLYELFNYLAKFGNSSQMETYFRDAQKNCIPLGNWLGHKFLSYFTNCRDQKKTDLVLSIFEYLKTTHLDLSLGIIRTLFAYFSKQQNGSLPDELQELICLKGYNSRQLKFGNDLSIALESGNFESFNLKLHQAMKGGYILEFPIMNSAVNHFASIAYNQHLMEKDTDKLIFAKICAFTYNIHMKSLSLKLHMNLSTLTVLLRLFSMNSNYVRCNSLMKQIHRRGHIATSEQYYWLVNSLCQRGSVIIAFDTLDEMYTKNIMPSIHIYNRIMQAYLDQSPPNFLKALSILESLPRLHQIPNQDTNHIFLKRLKDDDINASKILFNTLSSINAVPHVDIFNHMMKIYSAANQFDKVLKYFKLLSKSDAEENAHSYEILLDSYFRQNEYQPCLLIWKGLPDRLKSTKSFRTIMSIYKLSDKYQFHIELKKFLASGLPFTNDFTDFCFESLLSLDGIELLESLIAHQINDGDLKCSINITTKVLEYPSLSKDTRAAIVNYLGSSKPLQLKIIKKELIPVTESCGKTLHDNFVNLELSYAQIRRDARKRSRN
jgi:pentatricopeptide repeat protein